MNRKMSFEIALLFGSPRNYITLLLLLMIVAFPSRNPRSLIVFLIGSFTILYFMLRKG